MVVIVAVTECVVEGFSVAVVKEEVTVWVVKVGADSPALLGGLNMKAF